jgi:hypothetical protein
MATPDQTDEIRRRTSEEIHAELLSDVARSVGHFVEDPYAHFGDTDSGHGVLFGELANYGDVALKAHKSPQMARQEKRLLEHAVEQGFDALRPIDVAGTGLYSYLITERRTGLRHLGQLSWSETIASRRARTVLTPAVNFAGNLAGMLQVAGITHGDFQPKNVVLEADGHPVLVDLENAQMRLRGDRLARLGDKDLVDFGWRVMARGLYSDRSRNYRLSYLGDELIDPSVEATGRDATSEDALLRRKQIQEGIQDNYLAWMQRQHPSSQHTRRHAKRHGS